MLEKRKIKSYSFLGLRVSYGMIMSELAEQFDFMLMTADSVKASYLEDFAGKYPQRLGNVGIAEQNLITVAAGVAADKLPVFASGIASFVSLRCLEQIKIDVSYLHSNVKIIGLNAGLATEQLGNSHYSTSDIAVIRTLPNMMVVSPCDGIELYKIIEVAIKIPEPMYIRLTGLSPLTMIHKEDYPFVIGKGEIIRQGQKLAIITNGTVISEVLKLEKQFAEYGVRPTIVNMHTIKPLDTELLTELSKTHDYFVTVEEHSKIGGLGSAVSEYLSKFGKKQLILGIQDEYQKVGDYRYLLENNRLISGLIWEDICDFLGFSNKEQKE